MRTLHQQILHDRKNGMTQAQIAEKHNLDTTEVRAVLDRAKDTVYGYAVAITEESLDLIATNNGGLKPLIDKSPYPNGSPAHYFLLPENPNDHATILTADEFVDSYEFVGPDQLDRFVPIVPIGRGFGEMRLKLKQHGTENTTTVILHVPVGTTDKEALAWLRMGFIHDFGGK